jgi:putative transcriptional regulator
LVIIRWTNDDYANVIMKEVISNKIRDFRKEKGWRQVDLAEKLGILQSEVSDIETGKRKPNIYLAKRIAKVLGRDVNEVFPS